MTTLDVLLGRVYRCGIDLGAESNGESEKLENNQGRK